MDLRSFVVLHNVSRRSFVFGRCVAIAIGYEGSWTSKDDPQVDGSDQRNRIRPPQPPPEFVYRVFTEFLSLSNAAARHET